MKFLDLLEYFLNLQAYANHVFSFFAMLFDESGSCIKWSNENHLGLLKMNSRLFDRHEIELTS